MKGLSLNEAVSRMRGEPGTDITLTIIREGQEKPLKFSITRDVIKVRSVRGNTLEPGFGYLRISHFQARTAEDARTGIQKLKEENDGRLQGLILDLRNNPGGILSAAVGVSDLFLDQGLIVYTEGRIEDSKLQFNAKPADLLDDAPIVVLVNAGSASASEIVAGALQDHRRAVIMGQRTFGKGSVQTILPVSNDAALKLTTARYYTPSGRSIQVSGIEPDVLLARVRVESLDTDTGVVTEQNLNRRLNNDTDNGEPEAQGDEEQGDGDEEQGDGDEEQGDEDGAAEQPAAAAVSVSRDYALQQALYLLKGLRILDAPRGAAQGSDADNRG